MIPKLTSAKAPKPHWAKPKSQKGTVDPMTAIHLIMGDRIEKTLCKQKFNLFDGARRIEIIYLRLTLKKILRSVVENIFAKMATRKKR